jgi:hypothetical protein
MTGVVVTSIASPNEALGQIAAGCRDAGWRFWNIGDVQGPTDFSLHGCDFLNVEQQRRTGFELARLAPVRRYARKNIGYLLAIQAGVEALVETDDDNIPYPEFWAPRSPEQRARRIAGIGWVNVYRYFTAARIWPRGFPLEHVSDEPPAPDTLPEAAARCAIQQGLANRNPDVDAIYRLVLPLPLDFDRRPGVILGAGAWCPFNSQNTTWFPEAFPLLYLPFHCSFRMTDIWRSFVVQRICWENGWNILFHAPTVCQDRNVHDLMRDFTDELPGYLNNARIRRELERLDLTSGAEALGANLLKSYEALVKLDLIGAAEIPLVEAWIGDLRQMVRRTPPA